MYTSTYTTIYNVSAYNLVKLCSVFLTDISVYFEPISVSVEKNITIYDYDYM